MLLARVLGAGLAWVTDQSVLSLHLKPVGIREYVKGRYGANRMAEYYMLASRGQLPPSEIGKFTLFTPSQAACGVTSSGVALSYLKRQPWLFVYYPMMRLQRFNSFKEWAKLERKRAADANRKGAT